MGLSRTVSEINGDFSRKLPIFPTPWILRPPLKGDIGALGQKISNDGATGPRKKFDDIFNHVDTMHQRDRRTDDRHRTIAKTAHSVARVKTKRAVWDSNGSEAWLVSVLRNTTRISEFSEACYFPDIIYGENLTFCFSATLMLCWYVGWRSTRQQQWDNPVRHAATPCANPNSWEIDFTRYIKPPSF